MFNLTNILSKMPLLQWSEIVNSVHPVIAIGILLCILLWSVMIESEQNLPDLGTYQKEPNEQGDNKPPKEQPSEAAAATVQLATPRTNHAFKRLNPIQSVERQKLKRLQLGVVGPTAATTTPPTRFKHHFSRLSPNLSIEQHRRMLLNFMMEERRDAD